MIECSICLEEIEDEEDKYITLCNHIFHQSCLIKWIKDNQNCPICRRVIKYKRKRYIILTFLSLFKAKSI